MTVRIRHLGNRIAECIVAVLVRRLEPGQRETEGGRFRLSLAALCALAVATVLALAGAEIWFLGWIGVIDLSVNAAIVIWLILRDNYWR